MEQLRRTDQRKPKIRTWSAKIKRWFKLKYLSLLYRAKGGPEKVAKGFSIGLAIEMFTLPTFGLAAILILPLVFFLRASLSGALIGFLFGKLIYPLFFFLNKKIGHTFLPKHFASDIHFQAHWLEKIVRIEIYLVVGGMIVGAALGLLTYFPIKMLLEFYAAKRKEKRRKQQW